MLNDCADFEEIGEALEFILATIDDHGLGQIGRDSADAAQGLLVGGLDIHALLARGVQVFCGGIDRENPRPTCVENTVVIVGRE